MSAVTLRSSIPLRMLLIGVVTVVLVVPAFMIQLILRDRQTTQKSAVTDVSAQWGSDQTITGPVLSVPFERLRHRTDGTERVSLDTLTILPESLTVTGVLSAEERARGIYRAVLYSADVTLEGHFDLARIREAGIPADRLLWEKATVSLGVSDTKGIAGVGDLAWNASQATAKPLAGNAAGVTSGVLFRPVVGPHAGRADFRVQLTVRGSGDFSLVPVGAHTRAVLSSAWPSPGFTGSFLPEHRTVSADGFRASWSVLELNRDFSQVRKGPPQQTGKSTFGVRLVVPVDHYRMVDRSLKYAVLLIALTFLALFLTEMLGKRVLHPLQYAFIGLALLLFYLLLLSLSEQIGFSAAYGLASLAICTLIGLYTIPVLKSRRLSVLLTVLLAGLYTALYVLLRLEDYALLAGSLGLLAILAGVMYATRRIDWFAPWKDAGS